MGQGSGDGQGKSRAGELFDEGHLLVDRQRLGGVWDGIERVDLRLGECFLSGSKVFFRPWVSRRADFKCSLTKWEDLRLGMMRRCPVRLVIRLKTVSPDIISRFGPENPAPAVCFKGNLVGGADVVNFFDNAKLSVPPGEPDAVLVLAGEEDATRPGGCHGRQVIRWVDRALILSREADY